MLKIFLYTLQYFVQPDVTTIHLIKEIKSVSGRLRYIVLLTIIFPLVVNCESMLIQHC